MHELVPKDAKIYLTNLKEEVKETSVEELLPYGFVLK
jgi:cytidine deaminase